MLLAIDDEYKWLDAAEKANDSLAANNAAAFNEATKEIGDYLNKTEFPAKILELVKAVNEETKE